MSNLLPTSERILREIAKGLELRQKPIELDLTMRKLTIEVLFNCHTHAPIKVLYHQHGEDDLSGGKK